MADEAPNTNSAPETTVENSAEVPAPPALPESPDSESSQSDAEGTKDQDPDVQTGNPDEAVSEDEEAPDGPKVENGPNGQTVTMPDGTVVTTRNHPFPVSNYEQLLYDLTHHGDQLRYPYKPGDPEYSPYSDPAVPNSHIAQSIEREIAGYGTRVLENPETEISPMWTGLKRDFDATVKSAVESGVGGGRVELS
jgi:hypothetical protein